MGDMLLHHLSLLFPKGDIFTLETRKILNSDLSYETKVQEALSAYFKSKIDNYVINDLNLQAQYIHNLFPSTDLRYIQDQLNIYRDMPNYVRIVLRQIVYQNSVRNNRAVKREFGSSSVMDLSTNEPAQKSRKLNCTITKESDGGDVSPSPELLRIPQIPTVYQPYSSSTIDLYTENFVINSLGQSSSKSDLFPLNDNIPKCGGMIPEEDWKIKEPKNADLNYGVCSLNDRVMEEPKKNGDLNYGNTPLNDERIQKTPEILDMFLEDYSVENMTIENRKEPGSQDSNKTEYYSLDEAVNFGANCSTPETPAFEDCAPVKLMNNGPPICSFFAPSTPTPKPSTSCDSRFNSPFPDLPFFNVGLNLIKERPIMNTGEKNIVKIHDDPSLGQSWEIKDENKIDLTQTVEVRDTAGARLNEAVDPQLLSNLCNIFPDACPKYIRSLCQGKVMNELTLNALISVILDSNEHYPKRTKPPPEPETLPDNQLELLKELLPDADPDYLSMMCDKFEKKTEVETFINEAMETKNYPTKKDYLRRLQLSAQQKQYTTDFNVENFIKVIPDPHAFFKDPSRNKRALSTADSHYALVFMRNKFNKLAVRIIQSTFMKYKNDISRCIEILDQNMKSCPMKSTRRPIEMPTSVDNIPLLQELAYCSHKDEISAYLQTQKKIEEEEVQQAKKMCLMKTCSCCYDEEVLPKNIYRCENGCEFCKDCVVKSSEVNFGEGKLEFPCLMNCSAAFSLQTLQLVLSPKLFSRIAQKKTLEEVKAAGIEELEMCPFCDFATIIPEGNNIFTCLNSECMKESCRMCKEPNHVPLRCDEVEKDEDVKARVLVEDRMTEALLRKCYKCGVKFFKEEGCNKMSCSCGAKMCYVCGQPVKGYDHFNGNGGDRYDLCPLYSDTNTLNKENVLKGAQAAKAELGNKNLKIDPTADINQHYNERSKRNPQHHLLVGQIRPQAQQIHVAQMHQMQRQVIGPAGILNQLQRVQFAIRGRRNRR